jgi:hypothetical protein
VVRSRNQVVECLCCGVDFVATNLPELLTSSRRAIVTRIHESADSHCETDSKTVGRKRKVDAFETEIVCCSAEAAQFADELDITDVKYSRDTTPLVIYGFLDCVFISGYLLYI